MGNKHFLLYICILLCCVSCTKSNKKPIAKLDNETIRIVPFDEAHAQCTVFYKREELVFRDFFWQSHLQCNKNT